MEQYRPNITIDTKKSWSEDDYVELRSGAILFRNCGPCLRCNQTRINYDKQCFVDENEPYKTLASFRTVPGLGVTMGIYL